MRVLVLGATGMMGHMAARVLGEEHEVFGAVRRRDTVPPILARVLPDERLTEGLDVARFDTVIRAVAATRPDVVVNCVGIVKQLAEAKDALLSIECNSLFPHRLAELCQAAGARLFHLSTDCVFSGRAGGYTLDDVPDPVDLYGRSKLLGEVGSNGALTLRTSIVGRQIAGSTSLFEWVISEAGNEIRGFTNAIYTGLTTQALSRVIARLIVEQPELSGVWQVASAPVDKFTLVSRLGERLDLGLRVVADDDFRCDRSLDGSAFTDATGIVVPSWDEMLDEFAADQSFYRAAS